MHSYITWLVQSGANIKTVQELARHSTPLLTLGTYAHMSLPDAQAALAGLPGNTPAPTTSKPVALRATGTDDQSAKQTPLVDKLANRLRETGGLSCPELAFRGHVEKNQQPDEVVEKPQENAAKGEFLETADGRTRTDNLRFTKPLLCH